MSESQAESDPTNEPPARAEADTSQRNAAPSDTPARLTFRITSVTLLAVFTVAICVTPIAWARPWLLPMYLIPLLLLVWIMRVRTVVDTEGITARTVLRTKRFGWDEVQSFRLDERRWLRAVLSSGKEVQLPSVRVRDLPHLSAMSGGRLSDPTAQVPDSAETDIPDADTADADVSEGADAGAGAGDGRASSAGAPNGDTSDTDAPDTDASTAHNAKSNKEGPTE